MKRLAIITSHPIQYNAPWFAALARETDLDVKVFYLWDFGVTHQVDDGFKQPLKWDLPLLEGYDYQFVPNASKRPGTDRFWGLRNATLPSSVAAFAPDAVLMFGYKYAAFARFLLSWNRKRAPLFFRGDSHRLFASTGIRHSTRRLIVKRLFDSFAAFLYTGKANYQYFLQHGVPSQKLFFAPHSVDNQRFIGASREASEEAALWKRALGIPEHHAVILYAGKFEDQKRPADLLDAFVQSGLSDVSLLLVGAGELEPDLRRRANGQPSIKFASFQNQTMMPRTYATADLFVLPSFSESWGLAINEAMCMSLPIIASDHVGCAEDLVHSGQNGLVFPAGDAAALSDCLKDAFANRSRLRDWGAESRRIIQGYTYEQATRGLLEALDNLPRTRAKYEPCEVV